MRVFRLNTRAILQALRQRVGALVDVCPEVREVRLFGSLARGTAKPGSDADVLVLVKGGGDPRARFDTYTAHFDGIGIGCDVLVYNEEEWETMRRERRRLVDVVTNESVLLARGW